MSLFLAGVIGLQIAWGYNRIIKDRSKRYFVIGFYLVFSIGLLFVAMEEVSWGQWIFGFETPYSIGVINKQGEFNLHNIDGFHQSFEMLRVIFGVGGLIGIIFFIWAFTREISAAAILAPWFVFIAVLAALDVHNYYVPLQCCPLEGVFHFKVAAY